MRFSTSKNAAFTLVELSIVLVILGLLVGGVLAGQSLIRAAELRSVTTEITQYKTALNSFREKYFGLPGDITNATAFWGAANASPATCATTASTGPETCNGNGDGYISAPNGVFDGGQFYETFRAWQHLANAGLVEGNYTGVSEAGNYYTTKIGTNVPKSRMSGVGYSLVGAQDVGTVYDSGDFYPLHTSLVVNVGTQLPNDLTENAFLKPEEAWNIDSKVDDGRPGTGSYTAWRNNSDCTSSTDASIAVYVLDRQDATCSFNIALIR